jgi:hypothetical protein
MKAIRQIPILIIGLIFIGCASTNHRSDEQTVLREYGTDQKVEQQKQEADKWPVWIGWFGALWPGGNPNATE